MGRIMEYYKAKYIARAIMGVKVVELNYIPWPGPNGNVATHAGNWAPDTNIVYIATSPDWTTPTHTVLHELAHFLILESKECIIKELTETFDDLDSVIAVYFHIEAIKEIACDLFAYKACGYLPEDTKEAIRTAPNKKVILKAVRLLAGAITGEYHKYEEGNRHPI